MKNIFLIVVLLIAAGCATTSNIFGDRYNEAISKGTSTTIVKEGVFENIRKSTFDAFESVGYKGVLLSDNQQGFLVIAKDISFTKAILVGEPYIYKIILKFSKTGEQNKTRIDLVNATDIIWARKETGQDIQKIAEIIRK